MDTQKLYLCVIDDFDLCARLVQEYVMLNFSDIVEEVYSFERGSEMFKFLQDNNNPRIDFFIIDFYLNGEAEGVTGVTLMKQLHEMPEYKKSVFALASAEMESFVMEKARKVMSDNGDDAVYMFLPKPELLNTLAKLLRHVAYINNQLQAKE